MENLTARQRSILCKYVKIFFINYFLKFIITILISSLNQIFFLVCMMINISGICSFFRLSVDMLTFYAILLMLETASAGILLGLDIVGSKNFIVDEKKYFVWGCVGVFICFNIFITVFTIKSRNFIKKLITKE